MRRIATYATLTVIGAAFTLSGCGHSTGKSEAMTADLERDLALATAAKPQRTQYVSAMEQSPNGAPSGNQKGKRAPVRTKKPTPIEAPSPNVDQVAAQDVVMEDPAAQSVATATVPAPVTAEATETAPAPAAEPTVIGPSTTGGPSNTGTADDGAVGRGRGDSGIGRVIGGIIVGTIIRGGMIGDDHCKPRPRVPVGQDVPTTDGRIIGGGIIGAIGSIGRVGGHTGTGSVPHRGPVYSPRR